jgi:hypothetical protein
MLRRSVSRLGRSAANFRQRRSAERVLARGIDVGDRAGRARGTRSTPTVPRPQGGQGHKTRLGRAHHVRHPVRHGEHRGRETCGRHDLVALEAASRPLSANDQLISRALGTCSTWAALPVGSVRLDALARATAAGSRGENRKGRVGGLGRTRSPPRSFHVHHLRIADRHSKPVRVRDENHKSSV